VRDDAADVLSPPVTLSPEILELLEELGGQGGPQAQERSSESAFQGNSNSLESTSTLENVQHQLTAKMSTHPDTGDTSARGAVPLSKMSFSTIFAGTHTTSDSVPPQITNNDARFQPSQLLSASIGGNSAPFTVVDQITAQSHGSTGATPHFPQTAAHIAPQVGHANRLTNVLEQEHSLAGPFFKPAEGSGLNLGTPLPVKFPPTTSATSFNPLPSRKAEARTANNNNKVATLQQQLQTEGQFVCGPGSLDVKCNPKSHQINIGGFVPISTTPNAIVSSTVVFTSPRSVEKFSKQMSRNPNLAKEVLIKIVDSAAPAPPHSPPGRGDLRPGRARFGSRLANNAKRFANFFGAKRRRRDSGVEWLPHPSDGGRDVFSSLGGKKETVNMVRGFQVVSAADLAFDPTSLRSSNHLLYERDQDQEHQEEEICFPETAFYAGLLVACSLLMISGLVSVCSIRAVRRQRRRRVKARYFGGETSLDSYN